MIPTEQHPGKATFPCIERRAIRQRIVDAYPVPRYVTVTKTAYVVVVSLPGMGPEYSGTWTLEGRSGYPPTPPFKMCTGAQTAPLGVLAVGT